MKTTFVYSSIFSILLASHCSMGASSPLPHQANGVLVQFQSLNSRNASYQKRIHEAVGTVVSGKAKHIPVDWVIPIEKSLSKNIRFLAFLCTRYRQFPEVKRCELNAPLVLHRRTSHGKPTTEGARTVTDKPFCSLTKDHGRARLMDGKLSPFWAQEYIGADLAQKRMESDIASGTLKWPRIGVLDAGFVPSRMKLADKAKTPQEPKNATFSDTTHNVTSYHGLLVSNLINGDSPVGVAPEARINTAFELEDGMFGWINFFGSQPEENEKSKKGKKSKQNNSQFDDIYNVSFSIGNRSDLILDYLREMSKKSILVIAAGSDWPEPLPRNESQVDGIMVGSLYPQGYISHDSSEGENLDIAAPSDNLLQSSVGQGQFEHFGGTSGAAPLVTGTVGLLKAYLPDLSLEEAKLILKKTAFETSNSYQKPQKNGVGMLNTAKAVAVAQALRGKSEKDRFALLSASPNSGIFDFTAESQRVFEEGMKSLELEDIPENCDKRKEGFDLVRTSFNLQTNEAARTELIARFKAAGLDINAEFYENFDKTSLLENLAKDAKSPNRGIRQSVIRTASYLNEGFPIVAQLLTDKAQVYPPTSYPGFPLATAQLSTGNEAGIKSLLSRFSPRELRELTVNLQSSPNPEVRALAPSAAVLLDLGAMDVIQKASKDKDPMVVKSAIAALAEIPDDARKFEYFVSFVNDPKLSEAAGQLGTTLSEDPYRQTAGEVLRKEKDPRLRLLGISMLDPNDEATLVELAKTETAPEVISELASRAADKRRMDLLEQFYSNPNDQVRSIAVSLVAGLNSNSSNSQDMSLLIRAVEKDSSKDVKWQAARHLMGLGIAIPHDFDRFQGMNPVELDKAQLSTLRAVIGQWKETKKVQELWERDWAIKWFQSCLQRPELGKDQKPLSDMIRACQKQQQTPDRDQTGIQTE